MLVTHENLKIMLLLSGLFYRRMQNVSSLVLDIAIYSVKYFSENINFQMKICGVFLIFPQNMRFEYVFEMPDNKAVLSSTKQYLL